MLIELSVSLKGTARANQGGPRDPDDAARRGGRSGGGIQEHLEKIPTVGPTGRPQRRRDRRHDVSFEEREGEPGEFSLFTDM